MLFFSLFISDDIEDGISILLDVAFSTASGNFTGCAVSRKIPFLVGWNCKNLLSDK
jgi:hypothetical protein